MHNQSLATYASHTNHPTLPSQTKYSYQFPKTKRFLAPNPECPEAFYAFQSQLSQRMAGIGVGKKSDFTKTTTFSPPPIQYHVETTLNDLAKGKTFGCARDHSPDRSYLVPQNHKNPGVGQYQKLGETKMFEKYTMRPKTLNLTEKHTNKFTPGPAAYESIDFQNETGRYRVSKYQDKKLAKIDPYTKRFPEIKNSPGPSTYGHFDGSMESGHYVLSRFNGKGGRVFSREARFTSIEWKPSTNPGPSNYNIPTQFKALSSINRTISN